MPTVLRNFKLLALLVLGAGCAALVIGCGTDSGTATSDRPLTKAEFIKEVEALCRKGVAEKERVFGAGLPSGKSLKEATRAEIGEFVEAVAVEPYTGLVAQLSKLNPSDKAAQEILRSYEKALKQTEANPYRATEQNPFIEGNEAAAAYGLKSCIL